jgi:hypothetical protein
MAGDRSGVVEEAAADVEAEGNNTPVIAARLTTIIESRENDEKVNGTELGVQQHR